MLSGNLVGLKVLTSWISCINSEVDLSRVRVEIMSGLPFHKDLVFQWNGVDPKEYTNVLCFEQPSDLEGYKFLDTKKCPGKRPDGSCVPLRWLESMSRVILIWSAITVVSVSIVL